MDYALTETHKGFSTRYGSLAVIICFLPGSPEFLVILFHPFTNGFFALFLMISNKFLLVLSDIFHHHITYFKTIITIKKKLH